MLVPPKQTAEEQNVEKAATDEIKIVTETKRNNNEDSESIVFLEQEKENEAAGSSKDVEMKDDLEVVEVVNENMEMEKGKIKQQNQQAGLTQTSIYRILIFLVSLSVEFLANLDGHRITPNVVRFSPNGSFLINNLNSA